MSRLALACVVGLAIFVPLGCLPEESPKASDGATYTVEVTDYAQPKDTTEGLLTDDVLDAKKTTFDPELVDRRPEGDWLVNASEAVTRLDVPMIRPDVEPDLLALHPSYAAAAKASGNGTAQPVLPSVNMIDGKAKQFDDGLYAALDQAYYKGLEGVLKSHVELVRRIHEKVDPKSPAEPFLAAGLELAGVKVASTSPAVKQGFLLEFRANPVESKPIGFYTWTPALADCFRFLRFFQRPFAIAASVPKALAAALEADPGLLADYTHATDFYAKLTNPYRKYTVADLIHPARPLDPKRFVALFPGSTSRETELYTALFPHGLPPGADLMRELIIKIRSGAVDLRPRPDSGWYDYQVYALETLLLPEKGEENPKLLLTKSYKKRMLDSFKALMTKRRETHARELEKTAAPTAMIQPLEKLAPRLRLEPCPSYYLRTARAYAFLMSFLESAIGERALTALHGLREGKPQAQDLHSELRSMRDLYYGFYLLSSEDIGHRPALLDGEKVDRDACESAAAAWLARPFADPDLGRDTRVSVPIYADTVGNTTRLWMTIGVRLAKLDASYARAPRIKPKDGPGDWKPVTGDQLQGKTYLIPVDEFAEVELRGARVLTREELRAICDKYKTKEAILEALRK